MDESKNAANGNLRTWAAGMVAAGSIAAYALARQGNYSMALRLYQKGGGGVNIYKTQSNGQSRRHFAVDYHPFWDKTKQQSGNRLHYHRGNSSRELAKHRPWQGGW